jgi:hypothetical protein
MLLELQVVEAIKSDKDDKRRESWCSGGNKNELKMALLAPQNQISK